ncbi:MAG: DUF4445 domain-containing protein [Spirochaetes bacterium]|nr:DUF4445 domain-containing protein [Spirochaetota bacterium]
MKYHIEFEPVGRRGECSSEQTLLQAARSLGVDIVNICGGITKCGKCKVKIIEGKVSDPEDNEKKLLTEKELNSGYRLACSTFPLTDCKISVPPESLSTPQRTQTEGRAIDIVPEPVVRNYHPEMTVPTLEDLTSDVDRIYEAMKSQFKVKVHSIDVEAIRELSPVMRENDFKINILLRENEIISVKSTGSPKIGLAVDIGTTKIAGYLVDMESGETLASRGVMNPQISIGEDLITRIMFVIHKNENAAIMQNLIVDEINKIIHEMCSEINAQPSDIEEAVLVANTCIHHLFLRLPVGQLGRAPYIPAISTLVNVKARDIGLNISPGAYIHTLPNIAGFVGADHVAMLLATGMYEEANTVLSLDIGTNTEICLKSGGKMTSVSSPSGPAFEGAHIKYGMRAADGAIERVRIEGDDVEYHTIGHKAPIGICGSGVLDAVSEFYKAGILDSGGRFTAHNRLRTDSEGMVEFLLTNADSGSNIPEITITQKDVRQLQLAKGAISTAIHLLMKKHEITEKEIDKIIIAGAFGTYIDVKSAITIGMLPDIPVERVEQVGNAAGMGAKLALISGAKRKQAESIARKTDYLELATDPDFMKVFINSSNFGWNNKNIKK